MWGIFLFSIIVEFMLVNCEEVPLHTDSAAVGTDFVHFPPIQYSPHRAFQGPVDLTALQQTHVLGNFHHRFHPARVNYPFGSNPSQVLFVPQTHISPPQEQRNAQQGPVLRGTHQEQSQRSSFIPPQDPLVSHNQNIKTPKVHPQFLTNPDQSIKNSFPSNAPHTIKFSISSQNYNPNQVRHLSNSGTPPPPKIANQLTSNLLQGRFSSAQQTPQVRPLANPDFSHPQSSTQFITPFNKERNNYQNFNLHTHKHSFGTSQPSSAPDVSSNPQFTSGPNSNFNLRQNDFQQTNEISAAPFGKKSNPNSDARLSGSGVPTAEPQLHSHSPLIQSSIELKQDDLIQQQKHQGLEGSLNFPQIPNQQSFLHSTHQPQFEFGSSPPEPSPQPKPKFAHNVPHKYYEYQTTDSTQRTRVFQQEGAVDSRRTLAPPNPTLPGPTDRKLAPHKSQNHLQHALPGNNVNKKHSSDGGSSPPRPSPTAATTISTTYRNPKPLVKEITINLNDHKISGDDTPSHLYIKQDRQKEFDAIKAKEEKEVRRKNEKTQEEVINEQIQKLLQSHNLEIIGKDSEAQTNSQEVHLSKVSEQFKKYNYSVQLLNGGGLLTDLKPKQKASRTSTVLPPLPDLPDHIKKQYDIKLVHKDQLLKQFHLSDNHQLENATSNIFLANGQKLEIVNFSKDGVMNKIPIGTKAVSDHLTTTTTAKPPKVLFEELTKQVLPPGADFDLIKHKGDGQVERVEGLTGEKRVTFVFLEEQPDGSVKIQGVKGNTNEEGDDNEDVDSLIKKIKNGSLKLPPSQDHQSTKPARVRGNEVTSFAFTTEKAFATAASRLSTPPPTHPPNPPSPGPTTDFVYSSPYSVDLDHKYTPSYYETTPDPPTTFLPTLNYIRSSTRKPPEKTKSNYNFLPTVPTVDSSFTPTFGSRKLKTTPSPSWFRQPEDTNAKPQHGATAKPYSRHPPSEPADSELLSHRSTEYRGQRIRLPQDVIAEESSIRTVRPLDQVLRENGLNEMAKFLDQSGLNSILNETGPYTIFIPTDRAFKTLEAQLGGPEKAEDKFRENPRLLSGLLLHHVVPGSFRVEDLQDEMTGVSLAGTQLRVNTYATDDKRSKEPTLVTINGAKVSADHKDIVVPQGLAHSIDRVLFPLPIGDILQTLKNDREKRFTKFLKSLEYSGLADMLTGSKTYTVFAPTDKAFSVLTDAELDKLLTRREAAKTIVLRHIVPGTLYTAGMHYFQVKDSMETGQKITIKKELGKVKANSAQIVSANIPATNGVIHAVETLL